MKLFTKKCCRLLSAVCVCALLLPGLLGLSSSADMYVDYPTKLRIGEEVGWGDFVDDKGKPAKLPITDGQYTLLTYWASWCPDCRKEFEALPKLKSVLKEYDNVKWYLINHTDGQRETLKKASEFVKNQNVGLPVLYDTKLEAFHSIDVVEIPTTVIIDPQGKAVLCYPGIISSKAQLRSMLDYATKGADSAVLDYVSQNLLTSDGLVKTSPDSKKTDARSHSLLAQYAANTGNRKLLTKLSNKMTGKDLGNDLRLLSAFSQGKGFEVQSVDLRNKISKTYFPGNKLKGKIELSDLDLQAMKLLGNEKLVKEALAIIEKGYIGANFPLYYNDYNADKKTYGKGNIDMTEALMTVYHLAQQGKVKPETIKWLKKEMAGGGLRSSYAISGKAAKNSVESAGVYALTALIALETGESKLFTQALCCMEEMRSFNSGAKFNGRFSSKTGSKSFDQCMPLLLYSVMEQKIK